jgi:predicted transcriptional regulator
MDVTTIKLSKKTKAKLDLWREHPAESYDQVIRKVVHLAEESERKLNKKTIKRIEEARERVKRGEFITHEELKRRLGL